jgi:hypothetical protein
MDGTTSLLGTIRPLLAMDNRQSAQAVDSNRSIEFYDTPAISSMTPNSGPITGSTIITLVGSFYLTGSYTLNIVQKTDFTAGITSVCALKSSTIDTLECPTPVWSLSIENTNVKLSIDTGDATLPAMTDASFKASYTTYLNSPESKWFSSGGKLFVGDDTTAVFQWYAVPAVTLLTPPLGPTATGSLGITMVNVTGTNFVETTDDTKIRVGSDESIAVKHCDLNNANCVFQASVPQKTTAQSIAIEIALNGQQFTSSGQSFVFYDPPEVYVKLKQSFDLTTLDYATVLADQTGLIRSIATTFSVSLEAVTIVSLSDLAFTGRRRRQLLGSNEGKSVCYEFFLCLIVVATIFCSETILKRLFFFF